MRELELERTFLAKFLPEGLKECKRKEIIDVYIPRSREHPTLRIRKNGESFEITKKEPVQGDDASKQLEQTIHLSKEEFESLARLDGKKVAKLRHYYKFGGKTFEIDVFCGALEGLVLVDIEFDDENEKDSFEMPEFCLADVTLEKFAAGGMLCGKSYKDIEPALKKYDYKKLFL
ncbi:MAG: hypothetical protein Q7R70_03325 [Candidatus Diapherotrites archaeon]|nr:hypothetical protein [Candidatus Diapherotrites archaeon]